jgi:hypothetical protein
MPGSLFSAGTALRAVGQSTQHHRFPWLGALLSQSVCAARLRPAQAPGELHSQCFASVGQCAGAQRWSRLAGASCWISHRLRLGLAVVQFVAAVAHARCGHPLRFYIRPHFGKCPPVTALKLRFVSPTASRPSGFPKQALCKVTFAGERSHNRQRFPVSACPTRRRLHALVLVVASWHLVRRCALCVGSVACGQ